MRRSITSAIFLALLAVGCAPPGPVGRPPRPKFYGNVISLSPGTTELILNLGDPGVLHGRTSADNFPPTSVVNVPIVATTKPDYEKIRVLAPQLIVYDASLYSPQDVEKMKSLKADLFAISADTVDEYVKQVYELGSLLATEKSMNDYTSRINSEIESDKGSPITPVPRVAVVMPGNGGSDYISGSTSFLADAIKTAGGNPVGPPDNKFVMISPEALVAINPDYIIVPGTKTDISALDQIMKNPKYQSINAVKNKHVRVLNQDVLLRRGTRVDQLLKALHATMVGASK